MTSSTPPPPDGRGRRREVSPAEFTKEMPEGEGAGPGAPETDTPTGGRPGAGGHGPRGPGGAGPERPDPPQPSDEDG